MQKLLLELGRSDRTEKKGLIFLSSNTATSNSNNKLYFPTVLVEVEPEKSSGLTTKLF